MFFFLLPFFHLVELVKKNPPMNWYDAYVTLVIVTKIVFVTVLVIRQIVKIRSPEHTALIEYLTRWEIRAKVIFHVLMSMLLIYLFNPWQDHMTRIDYETRVMLTLFGGLTLLTVATSLTN